MSGQVQITGFKKLRNNINRLEKGLQRRVYNRAVRAGGKIVVATAKSAVPKRTGRLAASLVYRASSKPSKGLFGVKITVKGNAAAGGRTSQRRGVGAVYRPDAVERYYRFVETGTKYHAAKPFLKPALQNQSGAVLSAIKRELESGLEREARRLPK